MASTRALLVVFAILCGLINPSTTSSTPDIDIKKYIHWVKEDLMARHNFFPLRALQEELLTNEAAVEAVASLSNNINSSLSSILAFQTKEFQTAQLFMNETEAEGCVNGLSTFIEDAIEDAVESYTDCAYDANSNLFRFAKSLSTKNSSYWTTFQRTLSGIEVCARRYHNKDSYHRLRSCVEAMEKLYYAKEQYTMNSLFPSPSMKYFTSIVVDCASRAAGRVAEKGSDYLKILSKCSNAYLDDDPMDYERHLKGWQKYFANLQEQILKATDTYIEQRSATENKMKGYFNLKKQALDEYIVEQRGVDSYKEKEYDYLNDYYNTVMSTSLDNPDNSNCTTEATLALDRAVLTSSSKSAKCYAEIVNIATAIIENVHESFTYLNGRLPYVGNVALLKCFSQGYIFAPETIRDCYKITSTSFYIDYIDHINDVDRQLSTLKEYQNHFSAGSNMPCEGASLPRLYLEGERALYDLQRCLYIHSGTTYTVTTPATLAIETTTNIEMTTTTTTTNIEMTTTEHEREKYFDYTTSRDETKQ